MVILLSDYSPKITGTLKVSTSPTGTLAVSGNTMSGSLSAEHVTYSNGTKDYKELENKPSLQYGTTVKELVGTVSMADFGLKEEALQSLTNGDIDDMIRRLFNGR